MSKSAWRCRGGVEDRVERHNAVEAVVAGLDLEHVAHVEASLGDQLLGKFNLLGRDVYAIDVIAVRTKKAVN